MSYGLTIVSSYIPTLHTSIERRHIYNIYKTDTKYFWTRIFFSGEIWVLIQATMQVQICPLHVFLHSDPSCHFLSHARIQITSTTSPCRPELVN